jgi:hypothetical protein
MLPVIIFLLNLIYHLLEFFILEREQAVEVLERIIEVAKPLMANS